MESSGVALSVGEIAGEKGDEVGFGGENGSNGAKSKPSQTFFGTPQPWVLTGNA
uniref:Uncharacterized protein n=1 Tax=Oryza sativa subsp. japonica TaxID=39947 RepID=Q69PN9_ORYSJ|nr:hypothetical protein [Oryza sativa Japonica Group]BAD31521.1 hypothetical protein [Oryza sativa Japonica Group]